MLTPAFTLTQDPNYLVIEIKAPYAKVSDAEVFIEECDFKFFSKPYYLRLSLPKPVVEDGRETAKYDTDSGSLEPSPTAYLSRHCSGLFTIRVPKATPGEHFEGLDLLTKLLAAPGQTSAKLPLIQVLDSTTDEQNNPTEADNEDETYEEFDWQIEQQPYSEQDISVNGPKYGFANLRCGVLKRLQEELADIIDLKNADGVPTFERRQQRTAEEDAKFDDDHYLADLYDNPSLKDLLSYQPPWNSEYKRLKEDPENDNTVVFTEEEQETMRKLPRKEYVLDSRETQQVFLNLVDIIFAYAYNHRTMEGENTVESAWTVCKLSGTLSWLETYSSLCEVVVACYRRALCFPLYRHWQLTQRVYRDVQRIFTIGKRRLLKCLLEVHDLLQAGDSRYILNDLYITDYCVWMQSASDKQISSLARNLQQLKVSKADVGFDLEVLEAAGNMAVQEAGNDGKVDQTAQKLEAMTLSGGGRKESESSQVNTDALSQDMNTKCTLNGGSTEHVPPKLEGAVGYSSESYEKDVLPYKCTKKAAPSESGESSETSSSGDSGDSYSLNEDSDQDDSELFQYQGQDQSELDIKINKK